MSMCNIHASNQRGTLTKFTEMLAILKAINHEIAGFVLSLKNYIPQNLYVYSSEQKAYITGPLSFRVYVYSVIVPY